MNKQLAHLTERYPSLSVCVRDIQAVYEIMTACFASGHKLLIAGNGGSCADGEHMVGELMKGFRKSRPCPREFAEKLKAVDAERGGELAEKLQGGLPAVSLANHQALNTAYGNDIPNGGTLSYAQQVYGYGKQGDVLLGISTSGNAENVLYAAVAARAMGITVIGLTGAQGGGLAAVADAVIQVPETETYRIQELHLPVLHCLCLMLEEHFFDD